MPLVDLRCTALIVLVGCAHADRMDFAQADLMLQVLSAKPASAAQVDAVNRTILGAYAADAASLDHDIYFDVLASAYKATIGALSAYPSDQQVLEYFAHEMHHVGLGALVYRLRARLVLDADAARAFELVTAIVMEGTATYFINAHGDLAGMRADPQYADHLAHADDLLATIEQLLGETIAHRMPAEAFEQAASGYHSAGALIADAIYRAGGKRAIDRVMRDPRLLLVEYNAAVARLGEHLRPFAPSVADGIAGLGELARRRDSD
jgi:hypothetical protein